MKSKIENKESWEERFYKRFISQETGVVDRNTFLLLNATIANLIDFIRKEKNELRIQTLNEVIEKIDSKKFNLDFPISNEEDELMWRERKQQLGEMNRLLDSIILSLKQKS